MMDVGEVLEHPLNDIYPPYIPKKKVAKTNAAARYLCWFFLPLIVAILVLSAAVAPLLNQPAVDPDSQWVVKTYRHKLTAGQAMGPNKLVVMGGSGVYFGIRGDTITAETGVQTLNLGTHAGLPFAYHAHIAKKILTRGDSVLLPLEYTYYGPFGERAGAGAKPPQNRLIANTFLSLSPGYALSLDFEGQLQLLRNIPLQRILDGWALLLGGEPPSVGLGYRSDTLNAFGDEDHDYRENADPKAVLDVRLKQSRAMGIPQVAWGSGYLQSIRKFIDWCNANGVKVYATWPNSIDAPPYSGETFQTLQSDIQEFYRRKNVQFVGDVKQALLPIDLMLDTDLHPTLEGARLRSQGLAKALCAETNLCQKR